jgi:cytochrome c
MSFGATRLVIPSKPGSYISLKNVDLTGITQIDFNAMAPKARLNAIGGFIEVHMDSPKGKLLGKSNFVGDTGNPTTPVSVALEPTTGFHDLYVVFTNPNPGAEGSLMVVTNTEFKSSATGTTSNVVAESAPAADLNAYAGKYKMTGLPFEYVTVSVKEGKLMMDANGQTGELTAMAEADTFDASGQAKITFVRGDNKQVSKLKLDAQGFSFEGVKE